MVLRLNVLSGFPSWAHRSYGCRRVGISSIRIDGQPTNPVDSTILLKITPKAGEVLHDRLLKTIMRFVPIWLIFWACRGC